MVVVVGFPVVSSGASKFSQWWRYGWFGLRAALLDGLLSFRRCDHKLSKNGKTRWRTGGWCTLSEFSKWIHKCDNTK